jgi:2-amino-4-hydroxy-6-hydroxymethyldihydropteridine diphosphokinase
MQTEHLYLIALGSNRRHSQIGSPSQILSHAIAALEMDDISVFSQSRQISSKPIGPSSRLFANAAAIISTILPPDQLLIRLQQIEAHFGRRNRGQIWGERVLDLDIIFWSGGIWSSANPSLAIPHPAAKNRHFVLHPAAEIAADWCDPVSGSSIAQLLYRFNHSKRVDPRVNQH